VAGQLLVARGHGAWPVTALAVYAEPDHLGWPPDSAPVNRPSLVQPVDLRRVISTSVGVILVAAGVILRFAVRATFIYGLNMHVVGVIVMLAGVFGLLLSLLVWGPLNRRRNHSGGYVRGAAPLVRQRSVYQDQPPAHRLGYRRTGG